ncbi:hypothetical protein FSP39_015848 [Pinctada imbricata]|uniref:Proton-coupled folate transporter-like protein n=1 Tax=Pinctada imbricata TaxID=66713 RepID=A0AA88XWW5_PINIB|nr:hypothetical protein FSP39_015848 [Pinctada imbricata]
MFFVSFIIANPVSQFYIYNEIAADYGVKDFVKQDERPCDNSSALDNTTIAIQKEASQEFIYLALTSALPSFIPTLFLGSIADKYSRKLALMLCFTGLLIKNILYVIVIEAKLSFRLFYLANAIEGLSGYYGAVTMATFSIITDITTPGKQRALRISIMEGITASSLATAQLLTGIVIKYINFIYPMLFATLSCVLGMIFCILFIPDTLRGQRMPLLKTCYFRYILRSFQFYFKETPTNRRGKLILLLFILFLTFAAGFGTTATNSLFLFNKPFCWSELHYTIFEFTRTIIRWICSVLTVYSANRCIAQNKDIELIILGSLSYFTSYIVFGTSVESWMVYISAVLGAVCLLSIPITRSIMSRLTKGDEQGSLFAGVSCIEMLSTSISSVMFGGIYKDTVAIYPGIAYLLMSGVFVVIIILAL